MSVACQTCEFWFLYDFVSGMNKEYLNNCKLSYELHGYSAFLCQVCREIVAKFDKVVKASEEKVDILTDRLKEMEKEKERMDQRLEKMEMKMSKVE